MAAAKTSAQERRTRAGLKAVSSPAVAAAQALDSDEQRRNIVTLANGTKFRVKGVSPQLIREVIVRHPEIEVPRVYIEEKDREEENPNDPDYLKACEKRVLDITVEITHAMLLLGSEVVELGEGVLSYEDDEWIGPLEYLGVPINTETKYDRYLSWLRFYCVRSELDIAFLVRDISSQSGVTELEVMRAARAFRDSEIRRAN